MSARGVVVVIALMGCGREVPDVPLDATPSPDAAVDGLLECPFSGCPVRCGFNTPDGGELRIENLIDPDGSSHVLATAYFLAAQAGDPAPQPFPNVVDTDVLHCNTFEDRIYPFGDASDSLGAPATYGIADREYRNVGDAITLQERTGATAAFDLIGYENFITPFLGGAFHEFTYNPDVALGDPLLAIPAALVGGTGENADGHQLKVTLPGGPDLAEPQVFDFTTESSGVEIPPRPIIADFSQHGIASQLTIQRSAPFTRSWSVPPQAPPDLLFYVAVFDTTGAAPHLVKLCVSAKPGKLTLVPEDLATMPAEGTLVVTHLLHRTQCTESYTRRIDLVGTAATSTAFSMVP